MKASHGPLLFVLAGLLSVLPSQDEKPALGPEMAQIAAAYAAKVTASAVFVSGRTVDSVWDEELAPDTPLDMLMRPFLKIEVDREGNSVTARLGTATATAVLTKNLGCTLVLGDVEAETLRRRGITEGPRMPAPDSVDWPRGNRIPPRPENSPIDFAAIDRALEAAVAEPENGPPRRTRAVVVVHEGQLIAERYGEGYDANTLLPGWSMTKTLVNSLVGIRVRQGKLDLDLPMQVAEWPEGDLRRQLRLPDLLTMSSGLAWNESYESADSDVLHMLFQSVDHGAVQAEKAQEHQVGTRWVYSSGSTNLICRELRATFENDADYWAFPRDQLFAPLGIYRGLIETDPSGTFVGSSYGFLTARDWARIGLLYAQDGFFAGQRILPEGWVRLAGTPAAASRGRYGSQIWLNVDPDGSGPAPKHAPDYPDEMLRLDGHEGQYVFAFPSRDLVIARLGCSKLRETGAFELVTAVLAAVGY